MHPLLLIFLILACWVCYLVGSRKYGKYLDSIPNGTCNVCGKDLYDNNKISFKFEGIDLWASHMLCWGDLLHFSAQRMHAHIRKKKRNKDN